jgi:peptidoglycan/LPS O-acetylase OafA/YrhL
MNSHISPPNSTLRYAEHLIHPKYRADVDGLRAIAVLLVIGFHSFPSVFKGGFVGVDIFFVISGYLITTIIFGSLEKNSFSFVEFYGRRIKRIFPALILVLAGCFAFGWFVLLPGEFKQLGKHIAGGAGFISNLILWNESGYFDNAAEAKPLLHLWSLGVEEQFYIVWPMLLWLAWKTRFNLLAITIAVAALSFMLNIGTVRGNTVTAFYSPQTRFWELMLGSLLSNVLPHRLRTFTRFKHTVEMWLSRSTYAKTVALNEISIRNAMSVSGVALILISAFIVTKASQFPGWLALLPTLGTMLVISAGLNAWLNRVILSNRMLVLIGLFSYPLYLWHWPLLSFARIIVMGTPSPEIRILSIIASIFLAWLTYRFYEKPIRSEKYSAAKIITLSILMVSVGYAGYKSYQLGGLPFRFPKIVQEITTFEYDYSKAYRERTCFLDPEQTYSDFKYCETRGEDPHKSSLLLWGDSFSAHLYPGYKESYGKTYNVIQRTASGCPPILGLNIDDRPNCKDINDQIFELIKSRRPEKIILAAEWPRYDWTKIAGTISQLRMIGITDIDLIGPVPLWIDSLPKQLYLQYLSDPFHRVAKRMTFGLNPDFFEFEILLTDFSKRMGVNYISPAKILCNKEGCLTRLGDSSDTLTACDYGHLTETGSRFLVSRIHQP